MEVYDESTIISIVKKSLFFTGKRNGVLLDKTLSHLQVPINYFNWSIRFYKVLSLMPNIEYLIDLLNTRIEDFIVYRNIGKMTLQQAKEEIIFFLSNKNQYKSSPFYVQKSSQENSSEINKKNFPLIKWFQIDLSHNILELELFTFNFKSPMFEFIRENNLLYLRDLLKYSPGNILKGSRLGRHGLLNAIRHIETNYKRIHTFENSTEQNKLILAIEDIYSQLSVRDLEICKYRWNNSEVLSLEEIGKFYNLTRERIRQILDRIKVNFINKYEFNFPKWRIFFLGNLVRYPFPIGEEIFKDIKLSYPHYFYLGFLSEIFEEVPFKYCMPKNLKTYVRRINEDVQWRKIEDFIGKIPIIIEKTTSSKILALLASNNFNTIEQLLFFKIICFQNRYFFYKEKNEFFFYLKGA